MKRIIRKAFFLFISAAFFSSYIPVFAEQSEYAIKAIIFDLNGTTVDSEQFWFNTFKKLLEVRSIALNHEQEKELYAVMYGSDGQKILSWMIECYDLKESVEELAEEFRAHSRESYHNKITYVPGFESFFTKVSTYPLRFAIVSNGGPHSTGLTCKAVDLENKFDTHIYNRSHVERGKPEADPYLFTAKQLNVAPHECVAIEDSTRGIKSAQAAGIFCIGLNRGDRSQVEHADLIVDSYDQIDIEAILKKEDAQ